MKTQKQPWYLKTWNLRSAVLFWQGQKNWRTGKPWMSKSDSSVKTAGREKEIKSTKKRWLIRTVAYCWTPEISPLLFPEGPPDVCSDTTMFVFPSNGIISVPVLLSLVLPSLRQSCVHDIAVLSPSHPTPPAVATSLAAMQWIQHSQINTITTTSSSTIKSFSIVVLCYLLLAAEDDADAPPPWFFDHPALKSIPIGSCRHGPSLQTQKSRSNSARLLRPPGTRSSPPSSPPACLTAGGVDLLPPLSAIFWLTNTSLQLVSPLACWVEDLPVAAVGNKKVARAEGFCSRR